LTEAEELKERQLEWALGHSLRPDAKGYVGTVDANLFAPLKPATRDEFEQGDGAELDHKMKAVHSSSALAVNVFDYWRGRDAGVLGTAMGAHAGIVDVEFEQKRPTGLPGNAPNIDVVLTLADQSTIAVESKFTESYSRHSDQGFKPKYFERMGGEWAGHGLVACQQSAEDLQSGILSYHWLNAEQLLKHALGLAHSSKKPWSLWCVWYDDAGEHASEHAAEIADFAARIADDGIGFRSLTYQALFEGLKRAAGLSDADYLEYLSQRYFPEQRRCGMTDPGFRLDRFTWHAGEATFTPPPSEPHRV
jgi:hypothetical protein